MLNYVSLIVDIENSRGYGVDVRNNMQGFINECIVCLNRVFERSLKFDMVFSAGDEIQGLFKDLTSAVLYMRILEMMVHPVKIRAGIGVGEWNIKVEHGQSTQQDGPAYHRARAAIEEVRKKQTQRCRIKSERDDELMNHLINASGTLKEKQGNMQNIALIIMEFLYPFEKKDVINYNDSIKELLNIKNNQFNEDVTSTERNDKLLNVIEPIYIDGDNFDSEAVIIKKNMSSHIAEIMGSKRQNADMLIKRGNSIVIRSMDYIALQYIEREYK